MRSKRKWFRFCFNTFAGSDVARSLAERGSIQSRKCQSETETYLTFIKATDLSTFTILY